MNVLLSTTYFGPIQWYQKLYRADEAWIERHETFQKQTFRNRCIIATTQGTQALTVPIERSISNVPCSTFYVQRIKDVRISDHGNWRHLHWNALQSSYRQSPFFEYYADDFAPFYEKKWEFLADFNEDLLRLVCSLTDIDTPISRTTAYAGEQPVFPQIEQPYYQVFARKHGFLPDLSIVDLLFNMGPESLLLL